MGGLTTRSLGESLAFWEEHGYLVLPSAYSPAEIARVEDLVAREWGDTTSRAVVDNLSSGRRSRIADLSPEERTHSFKINDLYLISEEIRKVCLKGEIVTVLTSLLGEAPVLCNTLNLEKSSQQSAHVDALYMTPHTPNHLAAVWIALEDCHPQAGPLFYYPGSHKIPLYAFSNGSYHSIAEEMDAWSAYIEAEIASRGLKKEYFYPKKGDAFIWHANLVHGGGRIENRALTRKSLISHFFTISDTRVKGLDAVALGAGFWWKREPQPVPEAPRASQGLRGFARKVAKTLGYSRTS